MPHAKQQGKPHPGRVAAYLSAEEFAALNERYACVFMYDRGLAIVIDEIDQTHLTFIQFKRRHGVLGELWLQSEEKRVFSSLRRYEADRDARGPKSIDTSKTDALKHPYIRKEREEVAVE